MPPYNDPQEDLGYVEPTEIVAIIPPTLTVNVKFYITSSIIHRLYLKGVIVGLSMDNANMYLINLIGICASHTIPGVDQEALTLSLFLFPLTSEVILWLGKLNHGSITTWNKL